MPRSAPVLGDASASVIDEDLAHRPGRAPSIGGGSMVDVIRAEFEEEASDLMPAAVTHHETPK